MRNGHLVLVLPILACGSSTMMGGGKDVSTGVGDMALSVGGDMDKSAVGDMAMNVGGDMAKSAVGDMAMSVGGDMAMNVGGDMAMSVGGDMAMNVGGDMAMGGFMALAPCNSAADYKSGTTTITFGGGTGLAYSPQCLSVARGTTVTFSG